MSIPWWSRLQPALNGAVLIEPYSVTGKSLEVKVEPSDTIHVLKRKIYDFEGIPVEIQRLVYDGKALDDLKTLSDYGIRHRNERTIHLVLRERRGHPSQLEEALKPNSMFPTTQEAFSRIEKWEQMAEAGNFDADTHIVDPNAHYTALDALEHAVITSSEVFRCSGQYDRHAMSSMDRLIDITRIPTAPGWVHNLLLDLQGESVSQARLPVASLIESYAIVLSVLLNMDHLTAHKHCDSSFSVLLERADGTVAEVVRIDRSLVLDLVDALEVAISVSSSGWTESSEAYEAITNCIRPAMLRILDSLELGNSSNIRLAIQEASTSPGILHLCRLLVCFLDLGLTSYVGSHASRFDVDYLTQETQHLTFKTRHGVAFDCSLRPLTCLHGFLDTKSVWVFRFGTDLGELAFGNRANRPLSILTTIAALSDIWGPVWGEAVDDGSSGTQPRLIKKYHVSKGCIRRVKEGSDPRVPGAVRCHWYNWKDDQRRRFSNLFSRSEELLMSVGDKLLIGAELTIKRSCDYTLQEFEMNYGSQICDLGPRASSWKFDGGAVALQVAAPKIITIQLEGTFKKIPETTVKQSIWQKWKFKPERANPEVLNNYYGVEMSHCTGNVRRVPLKVLLLATPVQELLERQIPGWQHSPWGLAFINALQADDSSDAILEFWNSNVMARPPVGQLVSTVLEVLESTGTSGLGFRAALLYHNREQGVDIDLGNNEWASLLKDSIRMATYALVNSVCLECRRPDHTTSICGDERRHTVLQTSLELTKGDSLSDRVQIEPHSQTYKKIADDREQGKFLTGFPVYVSPESSFRRTLLYHYNLTVGRELTRRPLPRYNPNTTRLMIRASGQSFGGMPYKRDRTLLRGLDDVEMHEADTLLAAEEGLSQAEIEALIFQNVAGQKVDRRTTA